MNKIELFVKANQQISSLVGGIKPEQWSLPTPDAEWTVRDLLNHLVGENLWIPPLFAGKTIAQVGDKFDGDVLSDDPKAAWDAASKESIEYLSNGSADILNTTVHLSFGDVPGNEYLDQLLTDAIIHGWDLAAALGVSHTIEASLLQAAWDYLSNTAEEWRGAGVFGPAYQLDDNQKGNLQNKLLALTGRNPNWTAD